MKRLVPLCIFALTATQCMAGPDPIINASSEQSQLIGTLPDGGLPPVLGGQNIEIFRASHANPQTAWTYNHHIDMAQWSGRMYLAWTSGQRDEDVWPSHEMYVTTEDGEIWSQPAELFPRGVSISSRIYFFHAPSGHMLAIAGLRTGTEKLSEASQGGLVVREIYSDHTLGNVYTLIDGPHKAMITQPDFASSGDAKFVAACRELLANHTFLEQEDFGVLLGNQRMSAYDNMTSSFGKAWCFFHRQDGALVGVAKKGWTIVSSDEGKTWTKPVIPTSIHTDNGKEWVQRTSDGRYAYIFNPQEADRFPLVLMTSDDGVTFKDMRVVHGEVPLKRYDGGNKNIGPQYVRGISEWASDGTHIKGPAANDLWVGYSSNKEDIWVSRIPVPVEIAQVGDVHDRFKREGLSDLIPNWNTYSPKWGAARAVAIGSGAGLLLADADPYDYAKAERIFAESAHPSVHFKVQEMELGPGGMLQIELRAAFGTSRPVRLALTNERKILATDGTKQIELGKFDERQWVDIQIQADASAATFSVSIDGITHAGLKFAEPAATLQRLTFRTGPFRGIEKGTFPDPNTDKPIAPSGYLVQDVDIVNN